MSQKQIFLDGEGDNWFERNLDKNNHNNDDLILTKLNELKIDYTSVLEIGCSNGYRLNSLKKEGVKLYGIDPSKKAIDNGKKKFDNLNLKQGTADQLDFDDNKFDLVIFGFCLYLVDSDDLFKVSCEAHRVLKTNGHLIIYDFEPSNEYYNIYHHKPNVLTHKMDFSKMFTWSKNYFIRFKQVFSHENFSNDIYDEDSRVSINILLKKNDICRK